MINKALSASILLIFIFLSAFKKGDDLKSAFVKKSYNYLYISHTRKKHNPSMDDVAETINYKQFDMLWLGGDMADLTSKDDETMSHIDFFFDFDNPNTLWALGNHDYTDLSMIRSYTHREPYYAYYKNGISFIVLDTQDSLSSIVGEQKRLFESVIDTLKESTHLVIIHHKLIWMYGNPVLEPQISSVSNGEFGEDCFHCINPNNFYTEIYPQLIEVKKEGIEVICIAGDIGIKSKKFEYTTPENIHLLASGLKYGSEENMALLFHHNVKEKKLTWEFKLLKDL